MCMDKGEKPYLVAVWNEFLKGTHLLVNPITPSLKIEDSKLPNRAIFNEFENGQQPLWGLHTLTLSDRLCTSAERLLFEPKPVRDGAASFLPSPDSSSASCSTILKIKTKENSKETRL